MLATALSTLLCQYQTQIPYVSHRPICKNRSSLHVQPQYLPTRRQGVQPLCLFSVCCRSIDNSTRSSSPSSAMLRMLRGRAIGLAACTHFFPSGDLPFSPVHNARKFSQVTGHTSLKSWNTRRCGRLEGTSATSMYTSGCPVEDNDFCCMSKTEK